MTKHRYSPLGLICALGLVSATATTWAADSTAALANAWPAFRGPNSSGVAATAARPPWQISPTNGVLWSIDLAWSPSSPCVYGDRIFITTFEADKLETRAYSAKDGKLLWRRTAPCDQLEEYHPAYGSPATATPACDGKIVVSYFGSSGLFGYDLDGKELWQRRLPMAKTHANFGSGTSPLLANDRIFLNRDLMGASALLAFDAKDGHQVWEAPRLEFSTSYGTPILWQHDGLSEVIMNGALSLCAYDAATGAERWRVRGMPSGACTTPVVGGGLLYAGGWMPGKSDSPFPTWQSLAEKFDKNTDDALSDDEMQGEGSYLKSFDFDKNGKLEKAEWTGIIDRLQAGENCMLGIKPGGSGDATATQVAWKATKGLPYVPSPLYYDGRLYWVKDGGIATCVDAKTGQAAYSEVRLKEASGSYYSSPVAADGRIYVASMKGMLTVFKAGGTQPEIVHQADFGEAIDATPALVGDKLYLRTRSKLMAFGPAKN